MNPAVSSLDASRKTVKQLFSSHTSLIVPPYQRSYSWTDDEINDFWSDIQGVLSNNTESYFFGSMVLIEKSETETEVVDGQQRLATLTLLMSVIRDAYKQLGNSDNKSAVEERFLCSRDLKSKTPRPILSLNEVDDPLFRRFINGSSLDDIRADVTRSTPVESHKLLLKAYTQLLHEVREHTNGFKDEDALADIADCVGDRLYVVQIITYNEDAAYILFETLNDRGLELSLADLLKNYLFSKASRHLSEFKARWIEMSTLVGQQIMAQFIRHHWISRYGKIREKELYSRIKASVNSGQRAEDYIQELRKSAEVYAALSNPNHEMWGRRSALFRDRLKAINLFNIVQCYPLLMACQSEKVNFIEKVADWIITLTIRYSIIGGGGTGNLETVWGKAATQVRRQGCKAGDVKAILRSLYPNDPQFIEAFAAKTLTKEPIIKFLLASIERHITSSTEVGPTIDELSVEHIYPKRPGPDWDTVRRKQGNLDDYLHRIGNLSLLDVAMNTRAANSGIKEKQKVYSTSALQLNKQLATETAWGMAQIEARQKLLAIAAAQIWRF